jgi:hypothetical protein
MLHVVGAAGGLPRVRGSRYGLSMGPRLLIVAGDAAASAEQLPRGIRSLIDAAADIVVISPALPGRLDWIASDTDRATERADERLQTVLGQLDEMGADARGRIGADDPLLAFEDAIREFAPDHLLIGLRREDRSGWQERGLLDRILERFELPMTVFQLPGD